MFHCPCGWFGHSDDRVPASVAWIAENDVDHDHFKNNSLNCPDCGDSKGWRLSGEDDEDGGEFSDTD